MFDFNFPIEKYKFYTTKNKVIAVSTYAGRTVRGVAVCADDDEFDLEKGKQLAAARCNLKVAEKRFSRAEEAMEEDSDLYTFILEKMFDDEEYFKASFEAYKCAKEKLKELEETM